MVPYCDRMASLACTASIRELGSVSLLPARLLCLCGQGPWPGAEVVRGGGGGCAEGAGTRPLLQRSALRDDHLLRHRKAPHRHGCVQACARGWARCRTSVDTCQSRGWRVSCCSGAHLNRGDPLCVPQRQQPVQNDFYPIPSEELLSLWQPWAQWQHTHSRGWYDKKEDNDGYGVLPWIKLGPHTLVL